MKSNCTHPTELQFLHEMQSNYFLPNATWNLNLNEFKVINFGSIFRQMCNSKVVVRDKVNLYASYQLINIHEKWKMAFHNHQHPRGSRLFWMCSLACVWHRISRLSHSHYRPLLLPTIWTENQKIVMKWVVRRTFPQYIINTCATEIKQN